MSKLILFCLLGSILYTSAQDASVNTTGYGKFDLKIYKKIANTGLKNMVISPVNLKVCMAILYEAAAGKTKLEVQQALQIPREPLRKQFKYMLNKLQLTDGLYELNLGSRMYLNRNISIMQKYASILKIFYNVNVVKLNDPSESIVEIDTWIRQFTHNTINNTVKEDDLNGAVLLHISTVYYKGMWKNHFPAHKTINGVFNVNSTREMNTRLMNQIDSFKYHHSEELEAKIIKLPYQGENVAMFVMLPDSNNELSELICSINAPSLSRTMLTMKETIVNLTMPIFKFDFKSYFKAPLQQMGIRSIFEESVSLPLLSRGLQNKNLKVSNIIQKIGFEVNELGSTPYIANGTLAEKNDTNIGQIEQFEVTKPFLFFLHEEVTDEILLIGSFKRPMKS